MTDENVAAGVRDAQPAPGADRGRDGFPTSSFRRFIGIRVESAVAGVAELSLTVDAFLLQSFGFVHGGVYATLIDSAIANALQSARTDGRRGVTVDLNVSFLKPVSDGVLKAVARVEHSAKSVMIGSCDVFNEAGERVALGKATFFFREGRKPAADGRGDGAVKE